MEGKDLIQSAVLRAHGGNKTIVETSDFIYGAWFMLDVLKHKKMIEFEEMDDPLEIHRIISAEHQANFDKKK